jgi:MFS transporter, FHS family, L-fucose permease
VSGLGAFSFGALLLYPAVIRHQIVGTMAQRTLSGSTGFVHVSLAGWASRWTCHTQLPQWPGAPPKSRRRRAQRPAATYSLFRRRSLTIKTAHLAGSLQAQPMTSTDIVSPPSRHSRGGMALVTLVVLFAIWGAAQWLYNVLFPHFAQFFALSPDATTATQSLFNIAYCLFAIPSVLFQRTFGYKLGVIFALSGLSLGPFLIYPALTQHAYGFFFAAAILFGTGWSFFETSVNALVVEMGSSKNAVRRLSLAQAFYPIGLIAGNYAALWLLQSNYTLTVGELAPAVARPYVWVGLGILALAFVVDKIPFPKIAIERAPAGASFAKDAIALLQRPGFVFAAIAIAGNVMAQSVTWGATFSYAMQEVPGADGQFSGSMITYSVVILCAGRFIGTALLGWISPQRLLAIAASLAIVMIATAAVVGGPNGLHILMAASLFMAVFYATIMGSALQDLASLTKTGAGLLVTAAGLSAALAPFLVGEALALTSAKHVLVLALPCLGVVLAYALKRKASAPA